MTNDERIEHLNKLKPENSMEEAILCASLAVLMLFPGCENWKREGCILYDPITSEGIYLPLEDYQKVLEWENKIQNDQK